MTAELIMPLRYLIGAEGVGPGIEGQVTEVPWDDDTLPPRGEAIGYCNLLDERYGDGHRGYAPYLHQEGTSADYNEGLIDPNGQGFDKNLHDQFTRRHNSGFVFVELDNPDSYPLHAVLHAIDVAQDYSLTCVAKNPGLGCTDGDADAVLLHKNTWGIIVEAGAGTPFSMNRMRTVNGHPDAPVWFVNFGRRGADRALRQHAQIAVQRLPHMWASYASHGEYGNAILL
jgi:hypothetical protein